MPQTPFPTGRTARRLARTGVLLAVVLLGALACAAPESATADGVVVAVNGSGSLGAVTSFSLRTSSGESLEIDIGNLDLSGGAFPADHLREHLLTSQPVAVAFRVTDGRRIAYRLVDAPWLQP